MVYIKNSTIKLVHSLGTNSFHNGIKSKTGIDGLYSTAQAALATASKLAHP